MNRIESTGKLSLKTQPLAKRLETRDLSFADRLSSAVKDVNSRQNIADDSIESVIKGELGVHEGMMAIGRADTSLKLLVQVRGKVMEAYKEIIHLQI
ncbi:MAG: flagellar hook-basal body complex protein FliE [Thermodesulfobacteriota bacterium]|nr:flagellar hook-basal body complex protein FliE [Thermodesulfobacteriota bacterium]